VYGSHFTVAFCTIPNEVEFVVPVELITVDPVVMVVELEDTEMVELTEA